MIELRVCQVPIRWTYLDLTGVRYGTSSAEVWLISRPGNPEGWLKPWPDVAC